MACVDRVDVGNTQHPHDSCRHLWRFPVWLHHTPPVRVQNMRAQTGAVDWWVELSWILSPTSTVLEASVVLGNVSMRLSTECQWCLSDVLISTDVLNSRHRANQTGKWGGGFDFTFANLAFVGLFINPYLGNYLVPCVCLCVSQVLEWKLCVWYFYSSSHHGKELWRCFVSGLDWAVSPSQVCIAIGVSVEKTRQLLIDVRNSVKFIV